MTNVLPRRLASIDIFRAVTMLMMIFVNDLWSIKEFPGWLEHATRSQDALGFADTVFPAFLFIVGLSIPLAIQTRLSKGESKLAVAFYIGARSLALIIMGFFHVNLESYNDHVALLPKPWWQILITISFFMIWLDYPRTMQPRKKWVLQISGVLLLLGLALLYKGGSLSHPAGMRASWWGILGLIGWAYLLCAAIFLFAGDSIVLISLALVFFLLFNIGVNAGWLESVRHLKKYIWITGDGATPALVMAGVLISILYRRATDRGTVRTCLFIISGIGLAMLIAGFALRPLWGISKIRATPSWVMICTAISIGCLLALIYIADLKDHGKWFKWIRPGGTSTLTAYLLPYIHYAFFNLLGAGIALPLFLRTGLIGIIKCLLYAFVIIFITGLLEKKKLKLRI